MASTRMMSMKNLLKTGKVQDNIAKNVLSISFNSHIAEVEYEKHGDVYELVHTQIPTALQGQGLGTILAERIFDYLIEKNKRFILSCEFLESFYEKNVDKYKDFVVEK